MGLNSKQKAEAVENALLEVAHCWDAHGQPRCGLPGDPSKAGGWLHEEYPNQCATCLRVVEDLVGTPLTPDFKGKFTWL